jgi:para-aminobenzoate synthetase / 4-amino-4-deoxychorismate lyase
MGKPALNEMLLKVDGGCWRLFHQLRDILRTDDVSEVRHVLREVEKAVAGGSYVAGFVSYEASPGFDPALIVHTHRGPLPLVWFGIYDKISDWTPKCGDEENAESISMESKQLDWTPHLDRVAYDRSIDRIKQWIAAGDTYQVNYTIRMRAGSDHDPSPWTFFKQRVLEQDVGYSAFLETEEFAICSASPELFFQRSGDCVTCRPMKGTRRRGATPKEDVELRKALIDSEKDRAEHVMIVDMIRNDLGRIARSGTVRVESLFDIEPYETVWQMTSTVKGRSDAGLAETFKALFPCASITGAPKVRTMEIIRKLENAPRGIYTGAIGYVGPSGDARFSVAIRTALFDKTTSNVEYGTGGGIVWDSEPASEYDECLAKSAVLGSLQPAFGIFETFRIEPDGKIVLLEEHMRRMRRSAKRYDFPFPEEDIRSELAQLQGETSLRVRLTLHGDGTTTIAAAPIEMPMWDLSDYLEGDDEEFNVDANNNGASIKGGSTSLVESVSKGLPLIRVAVSSEPITVDMSVLKNKITRREHYAEGVARAPDFDDVLFWNERGELTETSIANLVLKIDGEYLTPPVESGLLPGVMREDLLRRGILKEQILTQDDIDRASDAFRINSVRGWQRISISGRIEKTDA